MSEVTRWIIIAITASLVLSWGFVTWRNHQRLRQPISADTVNREDSFWQKYPMLLGLIALVLAGLAQYALRINQLGFAAIGYWFAVILFISATQKFVPIRLIGEVPTPTVEPEQNFPTTFEAESVLSTAVTMTEPVLASEIISAAESPTLTTPDSLVAVVSETHPTEAVNTEPLPKNAVFSVWSGFTQPDSILLNAHEQILILDTAQQIIYRLNPNGQIVQQWSLPPLPEPNGRNLVLSPDGRRLYITDAQKGLVYAITLED